MVGVVSHFKFATPSHRKYQGYIKYMARDEATQTESYRNETNFALEDLEVKNYDVYNRYMSNPEKTSGLFNNSSNQLSKSEVKTLKAQFQIAQRAESNMWQLVVSFDNNWLSKFGAYQTATHHLDEVLIMNAARRGMNEVLQVSGMQNAVWSGAIHYNTDNIHIHLAIVEPIPTREKKWFQDKKTGEWRHERSGYLPYSAINRLKSQVANAIAGRTQEHIKFDSLIREQIGNKEDFQAHLHASFQLQKLYQELYRTLPSDKRLWKYGNNAMIEYRPQIDKISQYYIDHFHATEFQELKDSLKLEGEFIKETYGDGLKTKGRFEDYERNKMAELYSRLGNTVLKDISAHDKEVRSSTFSASHRVSASQSSKPKVNLHALRRTFQKSREELKRQYEFEQLQREIEQEL